MFYTKQVLAVHSEIKSAWSFVWIKTLFRSNLCMVQVKHDVFLRNMRNQLKRCRIRVPTSYIKTLIRLTFKLRLENNTIKWKISYFLCKTAIESFRSYFVVLRARPLFPKLTSLNFARLIRLRHQCFHFACVWQVCFVQNGKW